MGAWPDVLLAIAEDRSPVGSLVLADALEEYRPLDWEVAALLCRCHGASGAAFSDSIPGYDLSFTPRDRDVRVISRRTGAIRWRLRLPGTWRLHWRRGQTYGSRPGRPPARVIDGILSVLRGLLSRAH